MSAAAVWRRVAPAPESVLRAGALAVLLVGAGAAAAGLAAVEPGRLAGWLPPCPFRAVTGVPCPGCGITRALLLLAQLRVGEALALHAFAPLVLAGLLVAAGRPALLGRTPAPAAMVALVGLLALWIARLATGTAP